MSGILQRQCPVRSCEEVAKQTFLIRFISPEIAASAQPGQFVNVRVADTGENPLLRRPFSVSRIEGDTIELLFNVVGAGTAVLSQKKKDDELDVLGPLGQPFHLDADYDNAFLVGGGLGVAPFPILTADLLKRQKSIQTFVGFRNTKQKYILHMQHVHVATDDSSEGFRGNVVQLFEQFLSHHKIAKAKIFACGPTPMLKAIVELAKQCSICCEMSLEGQMACGIGICQGCPVERVNGTLKYALVCKDGPTFLSTDVKL